MTENAFTSKEKLIDFTPWQKKKLAGQIGGTVRAKALGGNTYSKALSTKNDRPRKTARS